MVHDTPNTLARLGGGILMVLGGISLFAMLHSVDEDRRHTNLLALGSALGFGGGFAMYWYLGHESVPLPNRPDR